jgi:hypothetical protein
MTPGAKWNAQMSIIRKCCKYCPKCFELHLIKLKYDFRHEPHTWCQRLSSRGQGSWEQRAPNPWLWSWGNIRSESILWGQRALSRICYWASLRATLSFFQGKVLKRFMSATLFGQAFIEMSDMVNLTLFVLSVLVHMAHGKSVLFDGGFACSIRMKLV